MHLRDHMLLLLQCSHRGILVLPCTEEPPLISYTSILVISGGTSEMFKNEQGEWP